MAFVRFCIISFVLAAGLSSSFALGLRHHHHRHSHEKHSEQYVPPRPVIAGMHLAMSADSAEEIMRHIALRRITLRNDSIKLIESDSVSVFGEPAYIQIALLHGLVRTIVVNFHPLHADAYFATRDFVQKYLQQYFGKGVISHNASLTYRRWEDEDGTMEASFSDRYTRVFIRLGKHQY